MKPVNGQQKAFDRRNLIFAVAGVAVILIVLAVVLENRPPKMQQGQEVELAQPVRKEKPKKILAETPFFPKTTVNIKPLVTKFSPLPDFTRYSRAERRKAAFIDYLTPIIEYQNEKILRDRARLEKVTKLVMNGEMVSAMDMLWIQELADKYDVVWQDDRLYGVLIRLARRVDIIPVSLAIVQAAKESSWGRSRYAIEANNLFGQWCYDEGCGVIPGDRAPGAFHEVRRFPTVNDAARSYIHNLNTHPRYATLRQIREQLRLTNKRITGSALANGLLHYSERRQAYVEEVKAMIEQFRSFQGRRTG